MLSRADFGKWTWKKKRSERNESESRITIRRESIHLLGNSVRRQINLQTE